MQTGLNVDDIALTRDKKSRKQELSRCERAMTKVYTAEKLILTFSISRGHNFQFWRRSDQSEDVRENI